MNVILLRLSLCAGLLAGSVIDSATAQTSPTSVEIQASSERERNSELLRGAIRRIASRPNDSDALMDAGNAALALGDANAALNFFSRANDLQPNNGRIKFGLAAANVRTENPFDALRLFDEAVKLGVSERAVAADRAMAFDLLGNFARAQQDYNLARLADQSDELAIKQAVSLSLSGKAAEADALLNPLLARNVGEAWRARAFMLAARGDYRESVRVTQGFMSAQSVRQFEPYLRRMPELTGAQQAAAIHLGHFPAQNIGRDSDAVRSIASNYPTTSSPQSGNKLVPVGEPLGTKVAAATPTENPAQRLSREKTGQKAQRGGSVNQAVSAPPARGTGGSFLNDVARTRILETEKAALSLALIAPPAPISSPVAQNTVAAGPTNGRLILPVSQTRSPQVSGPSGPSPTISAAAEIQPVITQNAVPPVVPVDPPVSAPATNIAQAATVTPTANDSVPAVSDFNRNIATASASQPQPLPQAAAQPSVQPPVQEPSFDLGAVVQAIEIPESEQRPSVTPVDLSKIAAVQTKKADPPKPVVPAPKSEDKKAPADQFPARNWVQIATGEESAFKGDMRRYGNKYPEIFKGIQGWASPWRNMSRLVVGPFDDLKAARKWEEDFRKAGGDGFVWQSGNGTVVEKLK